ncbi:MAG TPA: hypothetical protein VMJ35_14475 [Dongiaceae bacterium]|nr:hypothetical protein [Dongiaceae bacterium]
MSSNRQLCAAALRDYFRISLAATNLWETSGPNDSTGFFHFGPDLVCYGSCSSGTSPEFASAGRYDALRLTQRNGSGTHVPFDFPAVIQNLRSERYLPHLQNGKKSITRNRFVRKAYYGIRELLPVRVRRHFQKSYFKDWRNVPFPHWPVDFTADLLHQEFLKLVMQANKISRIPFIWFWPEGANSCAIVTHDVETGTGRDYSSVLMDMDAKYGFRASFQVIPEKRYDVPQSYWDEIRARGFEFNVHDLNHDGYLFQSRLEFDRRAQLINSYVEKYEARGFRAGAMYRNQDWLSAFKFSYDMSVPNVAHLEPQRGGCCTVMPYFIGNIVELPLTTAQDYSVFNILEQFNIDLWKQQISLILGHNGLISLLSHPDYLIDSKPRAIYEELLAHLRKICDDHNVWHCLPRELDNWWRARSQMNIVEQNGAWHIEGPEKHRARLAFASLDSDRLVYSLAGD